jgi:hypothetical protein
MNINIIKDNKGHVIGRELPNGNLLDGHGRPVGRLNAASNLTLDGKGHNKGQGDQRQRLLNGDN